MKIGIVVHSKTGHTLSVANEIRDHFRMAGHDVDILTITATNDQEMNVNSIILTSQPQIDRYTILIIGAPVRGFMLSPVMQAYLQKVPTLKNMLIVGYVTQFFGPKMGGNQAIQRLSEICMSKGSKLVKTSIIKWSNPFSRKKLISNTVSKFSDIGTVVFS